MDRSKQPGIVIQQVLLERASFSHIEDYLKLPQKAAIELQIQVNYEASQSEDGKNALLRLKVATADDPAAPYQFEVVMTGLVSRDPEHENMPLDQYATAGGVALLVPFAREVVASLTGRGRFGPIWIRPLNLTPQQDSQGNGAAENDEQAGTSSQANPPPPEDPTPIIEE